MDLRKEESKEIVVKLIKESDVFIHSFRPSLLRRLELDYEALTKHNPRIIYATASGYGLKGPDNDKRAFDLLAQAMSGFMDQNGSPGQPQVLQSPVCDVAGAMLLAYGIVLALLTREQLGIGQQVDTSLLGAALALQAWGVNSYLLSGQLPPKSTRGQAIIKGLHMIFQANDGWIAIGGVPDQRWPSFCRALQIEHLRDDPRFATASDRVANRDELVALLDQVFITKTKSEWLRLLEEADQMFAPVNTYAEVVDNPQVLANDYICEFDDPQRRPMKFVGIPVKLSKTPGKIRSLYPEVGEHTNDILLELGYSWEKIAELTSKEVVGFIA